MIAVFCYAFAHRKTHDFLVELALAGYKDVLAIAAPWQKLVHGDDTQYFPKQLQSVPALDTQILCKNLGFDYVEIPHTQTQDIAALQKEKNIDAAIISGARILKSSVINCFPGGVVNFHPGKIPETSGLDSFFYTIKNNVAAGITTHFIDGRVDAGRLLFFSPLPIECDASPAVVLENLYRLQLRSLRRYLELAKLGPLSSTPIERPEKNQPMSVAEKRQVAASFPVWRAHRFAKQRTMQLFEFCVAGELDKIIALLTSQPDLLEAKTEQGWTPLILAAFNQHAGVVRALLSLGANPNAIGNKGTNVLMYAKTALVSQSKPDMEILDVLIAAGANLNHTDQCGKTVYDYVRDLNSAPLMSYFERLKSNV